MSASSHILDCANNRYHIHNKIGKGSFAKVSKGVNIATNVEVAIKHIDSRILRDERTRDYMLREMELMKQLNHPNIVYLYDSMIVGPDIYMIFEYCSEGDLDHYLKIMPGNKISENQARYFVQQLVSGMEYLHQNKIIHRDIKPQNILLYKIEEPTGLLILKLADFGFAKELKDISEMSQTLCGTPLYMAPEIFRGNPYSSKADLWSLGVIIFEMVTGSYPFQIKSYSQLASQTNQTFVISSEIEHSLTFNCLHLIKGLIQKDPDKRLSLLDLSQHPWLGKSLESKPLPEISKEIDDFCIIDDYEDDISHQVIIDTFEIIDDWYNDHPLLGSSTKQTSPKTSAASSGFQLD